METVKRPAEQRVILHNVSWETYEGLLADHENSSAPRFTYDQGTLEITVLSARHEFINRTISLLVDVLAEEIDLDVANFGSTTFRREDWSRGFEPDTCFYTRNVELISGKEEIDPNLDPPPDLVIEVDITSPSLDKFPIYARFGVPEVWRYDGEKIVIFELREEEYAEAAGSLALPPLTGQVLTRFVEESKTLKRLAWLRKVREWVREHAG